MNETCDAINSWRGSEWPCNVPAAGRYRQACVHEHIRDGCLCQEHASAPAGWRCKACLQLDGDLSHECAVALTPLEPDGGSAA